MIGFSRQLGKQAGVQLNPTIDATEGFASDTVAEQSFGCVARLVRGPIDRAFVVSGSDVLVKTGLPESISKNALNAAHGQLVEALSKGAKNAVVSRIVGTDAKNRYILVNQDDDNTNSPLSFTLSDDLDSQSYLFAIKHHGCFSDGIKISVSAKQRTEQGNELPATEATLKVLDKSGTMLFGFTAPLSLDSVDDEGKPNHLQAVVERYSGEDLEVILSNNAFIPTNSAAYGKDSNGRQKTFVSEVLYPFTEGDTSSVTSSQYQQAIKRLRDTTSGFAYLATLGSTANSLISQLAQLASDHNILLAVDIPNNLTATQAIAWREQTGITSHLVTFLYHPVECTDPNGVSGRINMGTSGYRTALQCLRNSAKNNLGFAKKNYAVAGKNFPVQRAGMKQLIALTEDELSDLAAAGITPVIYEPFTGAGRYIFADAITAVGKETSYMNLINSVEIFTTIEREIAQMAKESFMFGPMSEAVEVAERMIDEYLANAETSGWLVKSNELGGAAYIARITPNAQRPNDVMNVYIQMCVEGCVRQVHITNEITRS